MPIRTWSSPFDGLPMLETVVERQDRLESIDEIHAFITCAYEVDPNWGDRPQDLIFRGPRGDRCAYQPYWRGWDTLGDLLRAHGINKHLTGHCLRHTCNWVDLPVIRKRIESLRQGLTASTTLALKPIAKLPTQRTAPTMRQRCP
jgi:integrase